jgi:hypothetical protein
MYRTVIDSMLFDTRSFETRLSAWLYILLLRPLAVKVRSRSDPSLAFWRTTRAIVVRPGYVCLNRIRVVFPSSAGIQATYTLAVLADISGFQSGVRDCCAIAGRPAMQNSIAMMVGAVRAVIFFMG